MLNRETRQAICDGRRLRPIRNRVVAADISFDDISNVFEIRALDDSGNGSAGPVAQKSWRADVLVNCAPFQAGESRGMMNSGQLLDNDHRIAHFEVGSCAFSKSAFPRTWGVESFREELKNVANTIIEKIVSDSTI